MGEPLVPGGGEQPVAEPTDDEVRTVPLGDEGVELENQPAGPESLGGGEFPDRDTPPTDLAGG